MAIHPHILAQLVLAGCICLAASGCATHTGNAALIGGAGGAGVGAAIGSLSANAGKGALIGGAIGAIGGAMVGNEMDKAERRAAYGPPRYRYYNEVRHCDPPYAYERYEYRRYEQRPYYETRTYEYRRYDY
jgi:hypothetical protein